MAPNEEFPLRIEAITAAWAAERRVDDDLPADHILGWQLVYVRSGTIEERCNDKRVVLRAGGILLHQPEEEFAMRGMGEIPPEVLRLDFFCSASTMDRFRGAVFHAEPAEQHDLNWLMKAVGELYEPPAAPDEQPLPREDVPFGARQQLAIHLENLLILLARRCKRPRKPTVRLRRERRQTALVEAARAYFAQNLTREVKIEEVCGAIGCTRTQLQQAFRARLRHTAMDEFSAMRLEYAAQLLARGLTPGEVAAQLGYCSGAYFSQKFRAATGNTPSAYRRMQQGLPARRQNKQQKDKEAPKTSIPEPDQKK